jgi:hypothetical protein
MAYAADGTWKMDNTGVADRVAAITSGSSDLMKLARTQGMQSANRRGLGNSTMGIEAAQTSALGAAVPIAQADTQFAVQQNLGKMSGDFDASKTRAVLAGDAQKSLTDAVTSLTGQRYGALSNTLVNDKIPADARNSVISSINAQQQQALDMLSRIYGVSIQPTAAPTPTMPNVGGLGLGRV